MKLLTILICLLIVCAPFSIAEEHRIPMPEDVEKQAINHLKDHWFLMECKKTNQMFPHYFKGISVYEIWKEELKKTVPTLRAATFARLYVVVLKNSPPKVFDNYDDLAAYIITQYQGKLTNEEEIAKLFGAIVKVDKVVLTGKRSYSVYTRDLLERLPALENLPTLSPDLFKISYNLTITKDGKVLKCSRE